jgi:phosphopantothenoylcysteine decarboxylase/phosphopantothenate--cysteine ligase
MGYSIADAFANAGAEVILVSGPSHLTPLNRSIRLHRINSASEMLDVCKHYVGDSDVAVFSAAVADFTPEVVSERKIKREKDEFIIKLKATDDIAATLGQSKKTNQIFVGFALETNDELTNARGKLERKNLDLIILNSLNDKGAGFDSDTNKITMIDKSGNIDKFELKQKKDVAMDILNKIRKLLNDA